LSRADTIERFAGPPFGVRLSLGLADIRPAEPANRYLPALDVVANPGFGPEWGTIIDSALNPAGALYNEPRFSTKSNVEQSGGGQ
jgi:hypothetical protein